MNARAQVLFKSGSDVAGKLAVLAVLALSARVLSTGAFASLALASTLGWMLAVATDFGLQVHLAKTVSRHAGEAGRHIWPLVRWRAVMFGAGVVVAVVASFLWLPAADAPAFAAIASSFVASAFVEFLNYAYRGLGRTHVESWLNLSQRTLTAVLAFALLAARPSLASLAVAMAVPPVLTGVVSLRLLRRLAPSTGAVVTVPAGDLVRAVAPIGAGIVLSTLYFRLDLFLLDRLSTAEAVAQYGAVFRMLDALRLFPAALLAVVTARMFGARDRAFLRSLSAGLFLFGAAVAVAAWAGAPLLIELAFGPAFLPAVPYFRILVVAYPLLALNYGLTTQLVGWDHQRAFAAITATAVVVNVAANLALIPRLGAAGAAWATVATEAWLTVLAWRALAMPRGGAPR